MTGTIAEQIEELSLSQSNSTEPELSEELTVLKAIYPEIQLLNNNKALSLDLPIIPEECIELRLTKEGSTKPLKVVSSKHTTGLSFYAELPISKDNYVLTASWVSPETISIFRTHLNQIIQVNIDDGTQDTSLYEIIDYLKIDLSTLPENLSLICQNYKIDTDSEEYFNQVSNMFSAAKLENFSNSRFSCSICLENQIGSKGVILPGCDHTFCNACLSAYFDNIINQDDVLKLQCPDCPIETFSGLGAMSLSKLRALMFGREFPKHILVHIGLPEASITKYTTLVTNSIFEKIQIHYPFASSLCPRCETWIVREDLDDKLVQCRHCKYNYCVFCEHSWHGDFNACGKKMNSVPDEVVIEILENIENVTLREKYESKYGKRTLAAYISDFQAELAFKDYLDDSDDIVRCPSCSMAISKTDGCNRMKCTSCTNSFCYLCLEILENTNPYVHYTTQQGSPCRGRLFEGLLGAD
ncbi:hypothetical protein WICPIJ_010095 [Wickerhamomyces pijperi]|uniref:RBR-type E3 ubiquitin transferase n=1 Tax=Wickerhamomyces pijperi TaxID=599730 RepID=A0A9P8PIX3_WICPI|nr:hypothetical protein WICPIJ_010095 [Wickerhamomyces pijperi]